MRIEYACFPTHSLDPFFIVSIPVDRLSKCIFEVIFWLPTELFSDQRCINSITTIVSRSVAHKFDFVRTLPKIVEDQGCDLPITHFIIRADVVYGAQPPAQKTQLERLTMINNINPVAHVAAVAIERKLLPFEHSKYEKWDQLFGVLARTVIVRAISHDDRHLPRIVIRATEHVAARFRRGIRNIGSKRRAFGKFVLGSQIKRTVHFVS